MMESIVPSRDVAFAIVALYLGADLLSQLNGDQTSADALLELAVQYAPLAGALLPQPTDPVVTMDDTGLDLVTGAFSYSGSYIAEQLLAAERSVRTLSVSPRPRPSPARSRRGRSVSVRRSRSRLPRSLDGVTNALQHLLGPLRPRRARRSPSAVANSRSLFAASRRAGARAGHSSQHRQSVAPIVAPLLPRQGARRARPGRRRDPSLDRPADLGIRRRARRAHQQHRLDPPADAVVRSPRRRELPRPARPRRRSGARLRGGRTCPRRRHRRRRRPRDDAIRAARQARPRGGGKPAYRSSTSRQPSCRWRRGRSGCSCATWYSRRTRSGA